MLDIFIFGTMLLLLLIVIGVYIANNKAEKILTRLEFESEQNERIIELLKGIKEGLQNK
jgi:hypothetical protein